MIICFCLVLFLDIGDMLIAKGLRANCLTVVEMSPDWMERFHLQLPFLLFYFSPLSCLCVM